MAFCGKASSEEDIVDIYNHKMTRVCALLLRGQELAQGLIVYMLSIPTL